MTIDGIRYRRRDLSPMAREQLVNLRMTDAEIARLQNELSIVQTARVAYLQALREALEDARQSPAKAWRKRPGQKRWGKGVKRA
ncbi:DUF6447 family protein [Halomonas vilamensis]|uniref:DUF6447 family protein n=1 Tax=Vreelandella vilamensis TaxID=531309 RepID=A0ABU1H8B3_9GAMM|nr:DUF6447 family protein [Halomonas vilamensis]MDR5900474.1 DUF6447 family protein [Halomonas vilamensis]